MLTYQTCLVTGASRGIGRSIAQKLGEQGATVIVNYRSSEEEAKEVVDYLKEQDTKAMAVQADVSDFDQVENMKEEVHDSIGSIDVLVNNAGINVDRKFANMEPEDWYKVQDVNVNGMFHTTKQFYEDLIDSDQGRLINISSVVGQQGNIGQANYATTKSAMFGFTRTIALELSSHDATANCVAPGFTKTDMLEDVPERVKSKIRNRIPLNRFAKPEDIASIVRFLASKESSYMTGQILGINGGMEW